ncbi:MAG: endo-1,4-beta-xylanase, partial [Methylobacteriaceae bacterium]|nr:endo-1,4-beta-xylanase [Methylobacteriaceae bacterium]
VRSLLDQGVPLDAIGLQGHLKGELEIDKEGLGAFVRELRKAGLAVLVTELDVVDNQLPADLPSRDAQVASRADEFIAAITAEAPVAALLTWGITDRYTWVPMYFKRSDGLPNRPLPLDESYRPKPFMQVLNRLRYDV